MILQLFQNHSHYSCKKMNIFLDCRYAIPYCLTVLQLQYCSAAAITFLFILIVVLQLPIS